MKVLRSVTSSIANDIRTLRDPSLSRNEKALAIVPSISLLCSLVLCFLAVTNPIFNFWKEDDGFPVFMFFCFLFPAISIFCNNIRRKKIIQEMENLLNEASNLTQPVNVRTPNDE